MSGDGLTEARHTWPIVVGGVHRSGTSLVRRILNAHSRIYCGPELNFWRDVYHDSVNDPLRSAIANAVDRYVPIKMTDERFVTAARAILPESDLVEVLGGALVALQERCAGYAGKPRWADKDPANVMYLDGWQRLLGDRWLFVHVVRNPLDTIASIKEIRFPWVIPAGLDGRIAYYQRYLQAGLDFGARYPDRYYRVVYERLVADPEGVLSDMMIWLGEQFEPDQLTFNAMPQRSGLEDPKVAKTRTVHSRSVGRWKALLTEKEIDRIVRQCGPLWRQIDPQSGHGGTT